MDSRLIFQQECGNGRVFRSSDYHFTRHFTRLSISQGSWAFWGFLGLDILAFYT